MSLAGWSDVGAPTRCGRPAKDGEGNAARGEALFEARRNTLVTPAAVPGRGGGLFMVWPRRPMQPLVAHKDRTQPGICGRPPAEGRITLTQSQCKVWSPVGWYDSTTLLASASRRSAASWSTWALLSSLQTRTCYHRAAGDPGSSSRVPLRSPTRT